MAKHRGRRSSAVEIQISATVETPRNGIALSENVIREAIAMKADTLEDPPGIELSIVAWKHGEREKDASNTDEDWIMLRRFLHGASIRVHTIHKVRSR